MFEEADKEQYAYSVRSEKKQQEYEVLVEASSFNNEKIGCVQ